MIRIVVGLIACTALQWPVTGHAAEYASLLTGREQKRWAQFQPRWTQFLLARWTRPMSGSGWWRRLW